MTVGPTLFRRVDLDGDSLLYFVHIPKTAGTSLRRYLDRFFLPNQVFPPEITVAPVDSDVALLERYPQGALDHFRLLAGHHAHQRMGTYFESQRNPTHYVTVLREPISQLLSEYKMLQSDPKYPGHAEFKDLSLDEFLDHPSFPWISAGNRQVACLLAQLGDLDPSSFPDQGLSMVTDWLKSFALVGIHERFEQTLQLMSFVFGWNGPQYVPRCNVAKVEAPQLTGAQLRRVNELTQFDRELYEWAMERFNNHLAAMVRNLGLPGDEREMQAWAEGVDIGDARWDRLVSAALDSAAAQRRQDRLASPHAKTWYEVVETEGFLAGHLCRDWGRYIQWIGPRPEAHVRMAFRRAVDSVLYIRVDGVLRRKMLDHFTVRLNDHPVPMQWTPVKNSHHFVGFVPRGMINEHLHASVLSLRTSSVARPSDVYEGSTDDEVKCLAVSSIDLRPAIEMEAFDSSLYDATRGDLIVPGRPDIYRFPRYRAA